MGGCFEYAKKFDKKGRLVSEEKNDYQVDQLFLGISLVAKMTKIDGRVSSQEAEWVSGLLDMICEHYGGDQKIRETCKNVFNSAKDDNKTIYQYAKEYQQVSNHEECEAIYEDLWVIAMADGELHGIEQETLRNVLGYLRLDSGLYEKYFHKYCSYQNNEKSYYESSDSSLEKCYEILKCSPKDSMDTIKKAYRKLASEYHPDKIQSKGLPEAFVIFANEKFKEINHVYEMIKKSKEGGKI